MKDEDMRAMASAGFLAFCGSFIRVLKEGEDQVGKLNDSVVADVLLMTVYVFKRKMTRTLTDIHKAFPAPMEKADMDQLECMVRMAVREFSGMLSQWRDCDAARALSFEVPEEAGSTVAPLQWFLALVAGEETDLYEVPEGSPAEAARLLSRLFCDDRDLSPVERGNLTGRILSEEMLLSSGPADQGSGTLH